MAKAKKEISYIGEAPIKKRKLKKFNLKEELIESGWEKPKHSGFKARAFGGLEWFLSLLGAGALIWLSLYRGFFNLSIEGLTTVPIIVLAIAAITLGELMFYFIFLQQRHKRLSFLKETVPFKIIGYIVGGITAAISPIAAILAGLLIPFGLNHAFANWVAKRNFDRRSEYYEPTQYAQPQPPAQPQQPKSFSGYNTGVKPKKPGKAPEATLSADLDGPQVNSFGPNELAAHQALQADIEFDDNLAIKMDDVKAGYKKAIEFLDKNF